eukprot:22468-Ditylum_brightwellii.AAC.1
MSSIPFQRGTLPSLHLPQPNTASTSCCSGVLTPTWIAAAPSLLNIKELMLLWVNHRMVNYQCLSASSAGG